jgi:FAR1 DNA-binding domain
LKSSQKTCLEESIEIEVGSNEKTPEREVSNKRSECKASIQVKLQEDGLWRVSVFQKDHNHELVKSTPSKKRNL